MTGFPAGRRRDEFGVVDLDILLEVVDLNREAGAGARERPAKWNGDTVGGAVLSVVDLSGVEAERRLGETDEAKEQPRLAVEIELKRRLAVVVRRDEKSFVAVDFRSELEIELVVNRSDVLGKVEVGVDACSRVFGSGHMANAAWNGEPALMAVETSEAVVAGKMRDGNTLVGSFGVDVDGDRLATKTGKRAVLDAAGYFVEGVCATGGFQVIIEGLSGRRQSGLFFF